VGISEEVLDAPATPTGIKREWYGGSRDISDILPFYQKDLCMINPAGLSGGNNIAV
jgi:hypothetical protein